MPRPSRSVPLLLLGALLFGCSTAGDPAAPAIADDPLQIHWERSLDDALAIARAENRPLLLAVNMDGESASDRIVREEYRDPAFVAASRHYVCVVASVFRHNARDYDDQGRRIPCPRLGSCTCGEHMANEPAMFAQLLADGDRVAPRHAVVLQDGSKAWDLSLNFDLLDIDRALLETARSAPPPAAPPVARGWAELARQRSHRGRTQLEQALARVENAPAENSAALTAALEAIAAHGDAGSIDALRVILARLGDASWATFVSTVNALELRQAMATVLREQIETIHAFGVEERQDRSAALARLLEQLDGDSPTTRAYLLARSAVEQGMDEVWKTVFDLPALGTAPAVDPFTRELPAAATLEAELDDLDKALREARDDAGLRARFAKASLDLARRRIESGGRDAALLFADAERGYAIALQQQPQNAAWWIERARTAYYRSEFAEEVEHARAALRAASGRTLDELDAAIPLEDAASVEALRWIGDGCMRRHAEQLAADPTAAAASMRDAIRAFAFVALSPFADDNDWTSFASSCGALGLWRTQFAVARVGARRVPGGSSIRQCLNQALWAGGRAEFVAEVADDITTQISRDLGRDHAERGAALWFAGYAWMLRAEDHRRGEAMAEAQDAYTTARDRFAAAAAARPDFAASCTQYTALCWLGTGLAAVRTGDRKAAADALVQAVTLRADLAGATDGLTYDVLDLVDKIGEWRAGGPSDVDPEELFRRIDAVAPDTAFYAVAIADGQLREALRADGRNPQREMRTTVDAAGRAIEMMMGLPNEEGDAYLRRSIAILRAVRERLVTAEDKVALAQADTIWAERNLERRRPDGVAFALREAARLLDVDAPEPEAGTAALRAKAAELRALLGEARPRWRNGR